MNDGGGVHAVPGNDTPVDPLRIARFDRKGSEGVERRTFNPSPIQAARGVLRSSVVMNELLRLLAWLAPEKMDALVAAWEEARAGHRVRLERYRTLPPEDW